MSFMKYGVLLSKRNFLVTYILYFTFVTWYYTFSIFVPPHLVGSSAKDQLIVSVSFNFIIVITLLLIRSFIQKFNDIHIIYKCSLLTSIVTFSLLLPSSIILKLILFFVAGIFFSIGQLTCFTYFWNLTAHEERGRIGGLIVFLFLPFFYLTSLMAETLDFSGIIMLSVTLSLGTLVIKLLNPKKKQMLTAKKIEKGYNPEKRTIFLYSVPWIVFSLVNMSLAKNVSFYALEQFSPSFYLSLTSLQVIAAFFGALGGGIIADFFGRRLPLVFSLTLYGIASALAGLVENYEMFYFVYAVNGLTWGILMALYLLVVWGDFSNKESCAKMYSIGLANFYLGTGVGLLLTHQTSQIPLITSSLASCVLIFISNIALLLAPEPLSEDFRQKIRLKLHMNGIRKIIQQSKSQG